MSESVIADFVGSFNSEVSTRAEPVRGRILLSEKRLVLAADQGKVTIPLSSVFDVAVGHVPDGLGEFFSSTVTIAFERRDKRLVAAVEADEDKIEKFSTVLFKAVLNGTDATLRHPARVGGLVTGEEFEPAKLFLEPGAVTFARTDDRVAVDLAAVTGFDRLTREINGADRTVLAVRHVSNGQAITTLAATDSGRKMSILGRYLRLEYSDLVAELEDVELSDAEIETLVAIYSTGPSVSLAAVLDRDASRVTTTLEDLQNEDLVVETDEGPRLTHKGCVVVSNRHQDVNE